MANDWLRTRFLFTEEFDSDFVEGLLNHCLDIGCSTRQDGGTSVCTVRYSGGYSRQDKSTTEAIQQLAQRQKGGIELWYGELRITLKFNPNDQNVSDDIPLVSARVMNSQFKLADKYPKEEVQGRVDQMIDFVESIAQFTEPAFAYATTEAADGPLGLTKTELREGMHPKRVTWLMIFSDQMVDSTDRERLEAAPAWEVRTLETGSVLLVVTNNPVYPDHEWKSNYYVVADYLDWETEGFRSP